MKYIPWVISIILALYVAVTTFVPRIDALDRVTGAGQPVVPTWTPIVVEKRIEVVVTATPTASTAALAALVEETPTLTPPMPDTPTPTVTPQLVAATLQQANLRTGPGTNYDIAGGVVSGTALDIVGRNTAGDWYQLANGLWIFGQLVSNAPQSLPVVDAPPPPPPTAVPTQAPIVSEPVQAPASGGLVGTINVDSWRFEISEVKVDPGIDIGRKSVIFLGYVFNEGTQNDTFGTLYTVVLQDSQGRQYQEENRITWAAQDKYGAGYGAMINPGAREYIAIGYDVPASENTFTLVPGSLAASWGQNVTVTVP